MPGATLEIEARTSGRFFWSVSARGHLVPGGGVTHGDDALRTGETQAAERWDVSLDARWSYVTLELGGGIRTRSP
jgi:hypothetical protein